jgi:deoxyribodipyrimidine photo-lyase
MFFFVKFFFAKTNFTFIGCINMQNALVWFRNDLRIHDHEPLSMAINISDNVLGVYCFDPRDYVLLPAGFPKTGSLRAKFIIDCVAELKNKLQQLGSDLLVYVGKPEDIIPQLCVDLSINEIYYHREVAPEERHVEDELENMLFKHKVILSGFWGHTLFHLEDLPFPVKRIPELFTDFRKSIERESTIRACIDAPQSISPITPIPFTQLPCLEQLGLSEIAVDKRSVLDFKGGENEGLERLKDYLWTKNLLKNYKKTRNEMLGANYSTKFSAWLAMGCLSPRKIYEEVSRYENTQIKNDSTYWLIFELMWRDYFRFIMLKHGNAMFKPGGIQDLNVKWKKNNDLFELWRIGKTGFPLVDANMQELLLTGYMSNRGRQNVASFLTKNLGINWQLGAYWFQSQLIDYDVYSNYGNWNYAAGIGNDARGFRYFNIIKQATQYDCNGDYVRYWLPGLAKISGVRVHQPYALQSNELLDVDFELTRDYWHPIVDLERSVKENERIFNAALKNN